MKKIIAYLVAFAIVYDIFTPLRLVFDGGKALSMLIPIFVIIIYDKLFSRSSFYPTIIYVLTCMFLMLLGNEYYQIPFLIQILFAYTCFEHFLISRDKKFAKIVLYALYGTLLLMVITSIPLFMSTPNLSRLMNHAEEEGIVNPILYWTISYQNIHSLPIYAIPLFYFFKVGTKKEKIVSLLAIIAVFILMLFADATTPLILIVILYAILLLYNPKRKLSSNFTRFVMMGVVMLIMINKTIIIGFLTAVQHIFSGSSTYRKIDELIYAISGQGTSGDLEAREEHLQISLDAFGENPFIPQMDIMKIGRHNVLFDQIVAMGLILSITFICFIVERIKRPLRFLSKEAKPYYFVGVMGFVLMGLFKNYLLVFPTLCVLPMIYMMVSVKK